MFQKLSFINELHELHTMIHYPAECSSPLILSFFVCPGDSEFSGTSNNPRHLSKVIFSLEEPLREMNHVNCGAFPTVPCALSLEGCISKSKIFQHSCGTYCSLTYAKKYQVYYHHRYSPSCTWEVGRKEKKSIRDFCA